MPLALKVKVKGRLKELFPKANLSKKRTDEISARLARQLSDESTPEDIDKVINLADEIYPFADIAREDDRTATFEQKVNELEKRTTPPTPPKTDEPPKVEQPKTDETPEWAKTLLAEVEQLKTSKTIETKTQAARSIFEKNEAFQGLDEELKGYYFGQVNVESQTPIEEQIEGLANIHKRLVQTRADERQYAGNPPFGGSKETPSKEEVTSIVDSLN